MAETELEGVGDASLGEWRERGTSAVVHIRRRLSLEEAVPVGEPVDVRGTPEERERLAALLTEAPHLAPYLGSLS